MVKTCLKYFIITAIFSLVYCFVLARFVPSPLALNILTIIIYIYLNHKFLIKITEFTSAVFITPSLIFITGILGYILNLKQLADFSDIYFIPFTEVTRALLPLLNINLSTNLSINFSGLLLILFINYLVHLTMITDPYNKHYYDL